MKQTLRGLSFMILMCILASCTNDDPSATKKESTPEKPPKSEQAAKTGKQSNQRGNSHISFSLGQKSYLLTNVDASVTDSYIQITGTVEDNDSMNFSMMLLAAEEKTFKAKEIQFSCGAEKAWCADRVSTNFGADLSVNVTKLQPMLKGTFGGKVVLCGKANPPEKEITDGSFLVQKEDILKL